jgi:two-component system, response regulator YesN
MGVMYKILLVDDEELVLKSLNHMVEWHEYGFKVIDTALSVKEAYEKIEKYSPDLVFTDIRMPGGNGLELIKLSHQEYPKIKFIIISGYAEFAYAQKAIELGAIGYCLKPFQGNDIKYYLDKIKKELDVEKEESLSKKEYNYQFGELKKENGLHKVNQTFQRISNYINEHFEEDLSPQFLANLFHINITYLSQLFKRETGITYTEYLAKLRIKRACKLLSTTDMKVGDIAEQVGFHDYFYFTRVFKKFMSISPSEYRGEKNIDKNT